jgi:DNA-binding MarR family transcriptional regulator
MLRVVSNWVRDGVYAGVLREGYDDLKPAHLAMFRYPGLDGMRPSQMATELQMTRQAVNILAGHLEQHGYISRQPDPVDGRGRIIRLTAKGRRLETAVHEHARDAELRITEMLGARDFALLRSKLEELFRQVTLCEDQ